MKSGDVRDELQARFVEMTSGEPQVVGILLTYYPAYVDRAVEVFSRMLRRLDDGAATVLVSNGPRPSSGGLGRYTATLEGDNSLREFSGWRVGIEYVRRESGADQEPLFVLANDTFCYHNKFGPITERMFVKTFREMLGQRRELVVAGEIWDSQSEFRILDKAFNHWVSTYLLAITSPLLAALDDLAPPCDMDVFFEADASSKTFLTGPVNSALRRHIENYLFNPDARAHWYGAGPLTAETRRGFVGKAKSILLEMYLSACCVERKARFLSPFSSPTIRQLRRLERVLELWGGPRCKPKRDCGAVFVCGEGRQ